RATLSSDVHNAGKPPSPPDPPTRIDTEPGNARARVRLQIHGRQTVELARDLLSANDPTGQAVRVAQELGGGGNIAVGDEAADVAGRDTPAAVSNQTDRLGLRDHTLEKDRVSTVHAVEHSDRGDARPGLRRPLVDSVEDFHGANVPEPSPDGAARPPTGRSRRLRPDRRRARRRRARHPP